MSDATVTLSGNLTDDPELKYTQAGDAVCSFSIAVNDNRKVDGEWRSELNGYYRISAWKQLGEGLAESLARGDRIILTGTIRQREWEDKEGNKRISVEVTATDAGKSLRWGVK